jgi:Uncharacterized protein conserved in bacteria (DUF2188)
MTNPDGGWSVRSSGASRASRVFKDKAAAVEHGRIVAQKQGKDLYIHANDGTIEKRDRYGSSSEKTSASDKR